MYCCKIFLLAVIALAKESAAGGDCCDVEAVLKEEQIIPDLFDTPPKYFLEVVYNGKELQPNQKLTPTLVKDEPIIKYKADPEAYYILIMADPDAPSRENPDLRSFLHCMTGNIRGDDVKGGEKLMPYIGSGPPKGSGYHRYVFLLYKQCEKLTFNEPFIGKTNADARSKFNLREFVKKYKLEELEAVNFYQAEYDKYTDVVQAQLKQ